MPKRYGPAPNQPAIALSEYGQNRPYCFNRKETKDHGEGGATIGAPLAGRVLILDDVISAGTSVRESVDIIRTAGAVPSAVVICLDRKERGQGTESAAEEVQTRFGIPVVSISDLDDLIAFLRNQPGMAQQLRDVQRYRGQYGVSR